MSESFSANRSPVSIGEVAHKSLKPVAGLVWPTVPASREESLEEARAVQGALNFLAALIAFHAGLAERSSLAAAEPGSSEGASEQGFGARY